MDETLLYVDVPKYYTWKNKSWNRRKQGVNVAGFLVEEASVSNSAASLRSPFAVILLDIYEYHKESMAEDFLHQQHTRLGNIKLDFRYL